MKVYFVRHGESVFNTQARYQFPDTPLSDHGKKQAKAIAGRFTHLPIDLILTSPYERAHKTALEIEKVTDAALIQTDLLIERRMPTEFRGKLIADPEVTPIHQMIREHFGEPDWHHSDEENFSDLLKRAEKALDFIRSQEKEHIVAVTHGYFLTILIYTILFDKISSPEVFTSFRNHTTYSNTGLTMCEFVAEEWKLLTWNDYAHLGE